MITPLNKISIIFSKTHKEKILNTLQKFGQTELLNLNTKKKKKKLEQRIDNINLKLKDIEFALGFLKDYQKQEKKTIWQKLVSQKPELKIKQIKKIYQDLNLDKIILKSQKAEENINKFQNQLSLLKIKKQELEPWQNLDSTPQTTKTTKSISGRTFLNNCLDLCRELEREIKNIAFEKIYQDLKYVYLGITFEKIGEEKVKMILGKYKFEIKEWQEEIKQPAFFYSKIKKQIKNLKQNIKQEKEDLKNLAQNIPNLGLAFDWLFSRKQKLEAKKQCYSTKYFTIINLWLDKRVFKNLSKKLKNIDKKIIIQKQKISKNDKPPVIIKNKKFVSPFESVTSIYGLPKFRELDPTPFLAPFFILFFALCLTDAGYGIIMAVFSALAIIIMKVPRKNQKFFRLLIYAGVVTFLIGALFGGWFGIELDKLPESSIKAFLLKIRLINPMTDTLLFMGLTFALGFAQIWFSQIVKFYHGFKIKNKDQIRETGLWIIFLGTLLFLGAAKFLMPNLAKIAFYIFLTCLIALIMLSNKNVKIFFRPFIGIITVLQTMIGFMSDILSYSRLMALGLATGIIGFIINIIAGIMKDMIPYAGYVIWIMILIGGHLFNLGINALGGFIHSARLQFVEFFPKFMEGGGKKFEPFCYDSKYVKIK